jgi:hypothetical protein
MTLWLYFLQHIRLQRVSCIMASSILFLIFIVFSRFDGGWCRSIQGQLLRKPARHFHKQLCLFTWNYQPPCGINVLLPGQPEHFRKTRVSLTTSCVLASHEKDCIAPVHIHQTLSFFLWILVWKNTLSCANRDHADVRWCVSSSEFWWKSLLLTWLDALRFESTAREWTSSECGLGWREELSKPFRGLLEGNIRSNFLAVLGLHCTPSFVHFVELLF